METISTECVSCGNSFERERKRGRPATKCVPCRNKVQTVMQFSKATGETVERQTEIIDGVAWIENAEPCEGCNKTFMRPKKRGRPPKKCVDCLAWDDAEKAATRTTSDETLEERFTGDKALLKGTPDELPKGAEAQCPPPEGVDESSRAIPLANRTKSTELTEASLPVKIQRLWVWNHENDGESLSGLDRLQRMLPPKLIASAAMVVGIADVAAILVRR